VEILLALQVNLAKVDPKVEVLPSIHIMSQTRLRALLQVVAKVGQPRKVRRARVSRDLHQILANQELVPVKVLRVLVSQGHQ